MNVEEIARDSGFSSSNYMGLVFKKSSAAPLFSLKRKTKYAMKMTEPLLKSAIHRKVKGKVIAWKKKFIRLRI